MGKNAEDFSLTVRKAMNDDINGIMDVACSEGKSDKDHRAGFLMDDYNAEYEHFYNVFLKLINELGHFYVIENDRILGFLIAYSKAEWLKYNTCWIDEVIWNPVFDKSCTESFIVVDKTAVLSGLTGRGLGSRLYNMLIQDIRDEEIHDMFAETIISPTPNFASLEFRLKQIYTLAGVRYENYKGNLYTDLVYHKKI